jgi:hypothetical protein
LDIGLPAQRPVLVDAVQIEDRGTMHDGIGPKGVHTPKNLILVVDVDHAINAIGERFRLPPVHGSEDVYLVAFDSYPKKVAPDQARSACDIDLHLE